MSLLHRIWTAVRGGEDPEALREEIRRLEVAHASDVEALSQRDRLLRMMVESSPTAMVLVGETGVIVFTNEAARELFFEGRDARGENFLKMLAGAAEPLRRALASDTDEIFTFDHEGGPETYHVGKRHFTFEDEPHTLITVRHMTHEVSRQEILVLKRTLRIIGHELANSMAPASSLLRSARQMLARPELHGSLEKALQTVEERLAHLQGFLAGLARLGQLPRPKKRDVAWPEFLDGLRALFPDAVIAPPPGGTGWFDPAQIQQVLINLVKNAHEAGGPRDTVVIEVEAAEGGVRLAVLDRGAGMSDDVMAKALVPAFTTKADGSGMGLTLCREIVEAHDGRLRIGRRADRGTVVSFWLPSRTPEPPHVRARLTLSGVR
ncbi:MAG TPA: ATP-binding protein [Haliangiales bacterium]|nr:ATP-binding protein [Haliangiales bacterium]